MIGDREKKEEIDRGISIHARYSFIIKVMEKKEVVKTEVKEEKKTEVKEEKKADAKEEKKGTQECLYKVPQTGEATTDRIFADLKGVNEQVAVLSYLQYGDLIRLAKTGRAAFQFIMDRPTRIKIMSWKPDEAMQAKKDNYIANLIRAIVALEQKQK